MTVLSTFLRDLGRHDGLGSLIPSFTNMSGRLGKSDMSLPHRIYDIAEVVRGPSGVGHLIRVPRVHPRKSHQRQSSIRLSSLWIVPSHKDLEQSFNALQWSQLKGEIKRSSEANSMVMRTDLTACP